MDREYVLGIDLGGTKVEVCLLDMERRILARHREPSEADRGLDHVIDTIMRLADKAAAGRTVVAAGVGTPGSYEREGDRLRGAPHTPVYETPGFIGRLRDRLKVPTVVENDANCLALAEFFASCAGRFHCVMAVILGTGMGSGLILHDRLYRGARGGAGEIGHATVSRRGRPCQCGRRGCPEAYLSGPSLSRRYEERAGKTLDVPDLYRLFREGEPRAVRLFEESCRIMGDVFANAVNILDLDAIILGGGVSNLDIWYEKVPPLIRRGNFGLERGEVPLIKARLGDSAGVVGAAFLALRERGRMEF